MIKNSTLRLWNLILEEDFFSYKRLAHDKSICKNEVKPKKETINKIIAYAKSVKGIKMKSSDKILISLN